MKLSELTEQLQQESNATIQQAQQTANDELNKFASDLKQQLGSVATTFTNDLAAAKTELSGEIRSFKNDLKNTISKDAQTLTAELATVESQAKHWVPKLLKVVKWAVALPIIATLLACGAMIGGSVVWWKLQDRQYVHMMPFITDKGEKLMIVNEPTWKYCNEQTITDKGGKKVTYTERCRKVE